MSRILLAGFLLASVALAAAYPQDAQYARIEKTLHVQTAIWRARGLLTEGQSQKAVEVLEEQLARANGSNEFLLALRDAYRAYVKDLYLAGQQEAARRYLTRLCIIDPSAAQDRAFQPQTDTTPRKFDPPPEPPVNEPKKLPFPQYSKAPVLTDPLAKNDQGPMKYPTRGVAEDVDPFSTQNQRETVTPVANTARAQELLSRGADEFRSKRYTQARELFEQAHQADPASMQISKAQWSYCIIKDVTDTMNQPGVLPARLPELKKQVETAISMAPGNMMATGQKLITEIEEKSRLTSAPARVAVKHLGRNKEGWQVTESQHFRIFHRKDDEYGERVAQIAERTRATMYRKWFNKDDVRWEPICELIVHANGAEYTHMTGVSANVPGHSHVEVDPTTKRIILRRVDVRLDIPTMLDTVLPHEATHVVLAGMFGTALVPRWADEGIAVLSEPEEKISLHRQNLHKHYKDGQLFGLKQLMEMTEYPHGRQIGAFYAQSVVLVEFLVQKRGPQTLTAFLNDAVRSGYDGALQRHYGMTFAQLEQEWRTQIIDNPQRLAATK